MKKLNKIFIGILVIEFLLVLISGIISYDSCGNACDNKSLLNPFANPSGEICAQVCKTTFSSITYLSIDLFILTIIVFIGINFLKGGNKNETN